MSAGFPTQRLVPTADWPESWRVSAHYDDAEIWGGRGNLPYTLAYCQRRDRVLEAVQRCTPPGERVLDVAAAQGNFALELAARGYQVTWNDFRGDLVDYVRRKSPLSDRLAFVPGNMFELGDAYKGAFNAVLALEVIEHVAHPDQFMAQLATLTREDGRIILSTPNGGYFRNTLPRFSDHPGPSVFESMQFQPDADGHIFLLHEDEMHSLAARAGLEVMQHELFTNPLSAGHLKTRPLHRVLPLALLSLVERMSGLSSGAISRKFNTASLTILKHRR